MATMEITIRHRPRARGPMAWFVLALFAALASVPTGAQAAPVAMTAGDFSLAVYASDGSAWRNLTSGDLNGFFGAHRCLCPDTLTAQLQLTSSGQADLGSSTVAVTFLLGANCATSTSSASCVSIGQGTFSANQSAASPKFDSSQVFQLAAGGATVNCANLTAGSTTLWALLVQDGAALPFALSLELPVIATVVGPPTAVTAAPANNGILVAWTAPADPSQVAGYQVLCLPRPAVASTAAYESCGLTVSTGGTMMTAGDETEVCSAKLDATTKSVRLTGLVNGTSYTVAVIAVDSSGGVSALSPPATATPQPTLGFYERYKDDGGAADGCAVVPSPRSGRSGLFGVAWVLLLVGALGRRTRRRRASASVGRAAILLLALGATARAQDTHDGFSGDWPSDAAARRTGLPPDWGFELGLSFYRPAVDSEFSNGARPFAETFSSSRHVLSEVELDRYLGHRFGTWGVGLRAGYYKVTGLSFLADGTRSGDETALRLIPLSLSLLYRADRLVGLDSVPLIPYLKAGLDGVVWSVTSTGDSASHTSFTPGWHAAAGMALGLKFLGIGTLNPGALPEPFALFFEWDYAVVNGLGLGGKLHVGDSTWFAGAVFDL
jgi:hypothetical protein